MATQYEQFKKTFNDQIKPSFALHAKTISEWNTADKQHYVALLEAVSQAKTALTTLKTSNTTHSAQFQRDIRAALVDKQMAERDTTKPVDLSQQVATIKANLKAWDKDQRQYQNAAKAPVAEVKRILTDWTHEKDPQSLFDKIVGAHHRQMVSDLETNLSNEITNRKREFSTKVGTGNKSLADMEKLQETITKYKATTEYKSVAEWKLDLNTWKSKKAAEIGKDIMGWEPLDLVKWKATRTKEVKDYLKLAQFDF